MITDMIHARSELGIAVASVSWRLEKALHTAASLSHGRDGASLSIQRMRLRATMEDLGSTTMETIDVVALEKSAPERAVRALVRAAVVDLVERARSLPPPVEGIIVHVTGRYVVRSSTRNMALFSFALHTTRGDLQRFREEARADRERIEDGGIVTTARNEPQPRSDGEATASASVASQLVEM